MSPPPPPPKKSMRPEPEEEIEVEPPKPKLADKMRSMAKDQPDELTKVIKTMMSE